MPYNLEGGAFAHDFEGYTIKFLLGCIVGWCQGSSRDPELTNFFGGYSNGRKPLLNYMVLKTEYAITYHLRAVIFAGGGSDRGYVDRVR